MEKSRRLRYWYSVLSVLLIGWALHPSVHGLSQEAADYRPADAAVEALVRDALRDRISKRALLDQHVFTNRRPGVSVRRDMPLARLTLSPQALPEIPHVTLSLITPADARARAIGEAVYYVVADLPQINGDSASLLIGTEAAAGPMMVNEMSSCCCLATAYFQRRDDRWTFTKWGRQDCPMDLRRVWDEP